MSVEQLTQIYQDLNFPNASVFHKALKRRGIPVRLKDVEEFVSSRSERQILAPPPKFKGNIISDYENDRWAADIISFVNNPVTTNEGRYSYILLVQDIFSRYLYARPLISLTGTTRAFEGVLEESENRMSDADYKTPVRLDTDGAPEFSSERFQSMAQRKNIKHHIKQKEDIQAIATLDAAIQNIKKALRRRTKSKNSNWLTELDDAIKGYNDSFHSSIKTEPNNITDDHIFSLKKEAAIKAEENSKQIEKRKDNLEKTGTFRVYIGKTKGLGQRADKARWSNEIHELDTFIAPGIVKDTIGNTYLSKLLKPVPNDSSAITAQQQYENRGSAQTDAIRKNALQPYVASILPLVKHGMSLSLFTKNSKQVSGFANELKKQKTNTKGFLELFSQFQLKDGKVYTSSLLSNTPGPIDKFLI